MPVAAQVMRHAATHPGRPAVRGPREELTYAALARRIQRTAARLATRFPGPGALAAITLTDPVGQLTAALAIDLLGGTPLLCDPTHLKTLLTTPLGDTPQPHTPARIDALGDTPRPHAPVSAGALGGMPLLDDAGRGLVGLVIDALPSGAAGRDVPLHRPTPGDLAWACFSSGSTGRPRAVVRTRGSWTGSFAPLSELTGIGGGDVVLVPGPLLSSLYGFAAVHALAVGATVLAPGRWSPGSLPGLLRRATAVHLVPHHLPELLEALPDGAPLRTAVIGGAALAPGLRERAATAGVHVVSYYGATELSFVAVDADGRGLRPFPGVEIEVRTPPGRRLGEVWARSPWLAEGYLAGAAGPLLADGDGWMSVGDVAAPYLPGEVLRLRGRGGGAIQTGGATVVPEDVEAVFRSVAGVGDIVVVGSPHPDLGAVVTAIVEAAADGPPVRAALEAIARGGLDAAQRPRRWYTINALPRTPSGKPARDLVAARLADGDDPNLRRLP
ncbi:class I adenylate-forming enzyme family protein [Nonomuraea sp. NPDC049714]|uniref:class I adenylate-forming enzyme family protein n=1 Tax=Nonomuraea sp. NPDC049714 TaxID=3364357 RepID=UPI0037B14408